MQGSFGGGIGGTRAAAFQGAMQGMQGSSFAPPDPSAGLAERQRAVDKANAWKDQGIAAIGGMGDHMSDMVSNTANAGLGLVTSHAIHQENVKAAEASMAAQKRAGAFGLLSQGLGIGLSLLCERRLKTDIANLDQQQAWAVVRDLPLYSFSYKAAPGQTVYGPMIDEVEPLDPSLVRPSLLPDDADGPIRGFDVMRHQAYESIALQQALQRIEALERRLAAIEARPPHGTIPPFRYSAGPVVLAA